MKFAVIAAVAATAMATPGYHYDDQNNLVCDKVGSFCSGGPIITHCNVLGTSTQNYSGNCNDNLAGECGHVCSSASCMETSDDAGDARCYLPQAKRGLQFSG